MCETAHALLEPSARSEPDCAPSARLHQAVRCCYSKVVRKALKCVIVDIDADGREDWAEQEPGEMRWYPFEPCTEERESVRMWVVTGDFPVGWPLITLTAPVQVLQVA